jgi:hypothetical protein
MIGNKSFERDLVDAINKDILKIVIAHDVARPDTMSKQLTELFCTMAVEFKTLGLSDKFEKLLAESRRL